MARCQHVLPLHADQGAAALRYAAAAQESEATEYVTGKSQSSFVVMHTAQQSAALLHRRNPVGINKRQLGGRQRANGQVGVPTSAATGLAPWQCNIGRRSILGNPEGSSLRDAVGVLACKQPDRVPGRLLRVLDLQCRFVGFKGRVSMSLPPYEQASQ